MFMLVFIRDLGSSLMYFGGFLALLYVATNRLSFVVIGMGMFALGAWFFASTVSHVQDRVDIWLDPFNPEWVEKEGYQLAQSVFAQADGGLFGTGLRGLAAARAGRPVADPGAADRPHLLRDRQRGRARRRAAGCCSSTCCWSSAASRIAMVSGDSFSKLLASGLTAVLALQVFVIVGGVTRVIPLTGVTLPFVSYGGSVDPGQLRARGAAAAGLRPRAAAAGRAGEAGAAVNGSIARLFGLVLVLFALLVGFTSRWTVFEAEALRDNDNNRRELLAEQLIKRGLIRADDGKVLAAQPGAAAEALRPPLPDRPAVRPRGRLHVDRPRPLRARGLLQRPADGPRDGRVDAVARLLGPAKVGDDLRTTLSPRAQKVATDALAARPQRGAVVAMELKTGAVKVLATKPSFDPNADDCGANRNVATQDRFPPGSTMKVVTAAAALDSGKYEPDSRVDGRTARRSRARRWTTSAARTSARSTSTRADELGQHRLGRAWPRTSARRRWPSTWRSSGSTRTRRWTTPTSRWSPAASTRAASGSCRRPPTASTSAAWRSARATSRRRRCRWPPWRRRSATSGVRMEPRLVAKIVDPDGRTVDEPLPEEAERVMSEETAHEVGDMMRNVVKEGTGTAAALEGVDVAGKTGTAEVNNKGLNDPWFIGFTDRFAVAVVFERVQGGTGGTLAAPVAKPSSSRSASRPMQRIERDTIIDERYRVLDRLGSGGMADVYCAEDTQLGRKVAVKLLYRRFAEDSEFVERFRREASSAAGLQHPNIVGVFDRGEWDGTYYIAMEYLKGHTLKQLVREHGAMPPDLAVDITIQVLRAAKFAHKRGVVHRDIKPHNVILDEEGRAKVTDFGIARAGASDMTETGSIMGTAQYLSPEQAQGQPVSPRSDLYSIGVMLYELLTGQVPFDAESPVTIALKHVSEAPVPPSQLNPAVPPALEAVVLRALEKDPALRFADADEFAAALLEARERPTVVAAREVQLEPYPMPGEPFVEEERSARAGGCGCCSRCC